MISSNLARVLICGILTAGGVLSLLFGGSDHGPAMALFGAAAGFASTGGAGGDAGAGKLIKPVAPMAGLLAGLLIGGAL